MRDFRGLGVWQKGHALVLQVYQATQSFPGEEKFGLAFQELQDKTQEIKRMLAPFIKRLRN